MSNVRDIFSGLESMDVSFTKENGIGSGTVKCWDLDEVDSVERAHLPVRILLPTEAWEAGGEPWVPMSMGTSGVSGMMNWRVTDLMLWAGASGGRGIRDYLPDLVRYAGAYLETVSDNRAIATNIRLNSFEPRIGVFEWPIGSGKEFFGVEVLMTWQELINP